MASLRNLVITILRLAGAASIAAASRYHARRPSRPLQTIMNCPPDVPRPWHPVPGRQPGPCHAFSAGVAGYLLRDLPDVAARIGEGDRPHAPGTIRRAAEQRH